MAEAKNAAAASALASGGVFDTAKSGGAGNVKLTTGMAKFRRAMTSIRDLNHQQSLFVPKAKRLSEMHTMLHRSIPGPEDDKTAQINRKHSEAELQAQKFLQDMEDAEEPDAKERIQKVLAHHWWQLTVSVVTIFALYGDDFRLAVCPKSVDLTFSIISFLALLLFTTELLLQVRLARR